VENILIHTLCVGFQLASNPREIDN